ncbi:hypothetical protein A8L34_23320 [Bacillus sp. FJAT-27264]|uniref:hypothetical protein n=1 Tax=Paenibacillus sp. (strain DSM 101736 / FJAT-27264) TaxID=1850362 RepID=UPI0008080E43|nr:hypothetical protein [Bacillus sp. FJAT-27264]OBZ09076.1 hypothetical protein A8L34_23320 [Bacillus sp. FJAT-27264]
MNSSTYSKASLFKLTIKSFLILFCVPILSVWTVGSLICAAISLIAALLGLFGWNGIAMNISPGYALPGILGFPAGLLLAFLLVLSSYYTRRFLKKSLQFIKS